jgi:hypothetical protein
LNSSSQSEVVVVGARPVGLSAALQLSLDGIGVQVIERRQPPSTQPRTHRERPHHGALPQLGDRRSRTFGRLVTRTINQFGVPHEPVGGRVRNPGIRRGLVERGLQRRTILPGDIGVTCEPRQPVTESCRNQVRRRARNSNAHLHCGALPGPMPNAALASKISLDREHCTSYHHGSGRRGSGSRKAFPAQGPPTRQADEWANRSSPDSRLILIGLPTFRPSAFAPPTQRRGA